MQMPDDRTRAEKQQYLRENVMNRGYDILKFVTYLQSLRGISHPLYQKRTATWWTIGRWQRSRRS